MVFCICSYLIGSFMNTKILVIAILGLIFSGCGNSSGNATGSRSQLAVGTWQNDTPSLGNLQINADGTGSDSICGPFTWVSTGNDLAQITMINPTPAGCMPQGANNCMMSFSYLGSVLQMGAYCDNGGWAGEYSKE